MSWVWMLGLAGVFQGICNFSFRQMSVATSSVYALAAFFIASGVLFLGYAAAMKDSDLTKTAWLWVGALVVTIFASNVLLMKGFGSGEAPAGIGYLIFNMTSLSVVVVLGMLLLGERLNIYGWIGIVMAACAIVLLANGKAV